jgi:hypothetical protein
MIAGKLAGWGGKVKLQTVVRCLLQKAEPQLAKAG